MDDQSQAYKSMLIRASAGAGKTYELSSRYISLLAAGESPDHILATTFTRKAAGEIQDRILLRLAKAALDPEEAGDIAGSIPQGTFSQGQAAGILASLVREQHRLNICTLDSFFFRIALSFGLELGLMPGWEVSDDLMNARLHREAVRAVCGGRESKELADLVRVLKKGALKRGVHQEIEREVSELHEIYRQTSLKVWEWLIPPKGLEQQQLKSLIQQLKGLPVPQTAKGENNKNWEKAFAEAQSLIDQGKWQEFIAKGVAAKLLAGEKKYQRAAITEPVEAVYTGLIAHARSILLGRLSKQTAATYKLLELFDAEISKQRSLSRTLGFSDIKFKLTESSAWGELDELYYRLDSQIFHLLLDEFQDTSLAEWQVLLPIADEILSKAGSDYSFFCVGDVKQAIYGWRGGVAEIFNNLQDRWEQIESIPRETSFRCSPPVISTVNTIFKNIAENPCFAEHPQAAIEWGARFSEHTAAYPDRAGYAALIAAPADADPEDQDDAVLNQCAKVVKELGQASPAASIGVLVRRNSMVADLIEVFSQPEFRIAASEEGGTSLSDSPAVSVIVSLLICTDHPGDEIARFHVAASPLGRFFDYTDYGDPGGALTLGRKVRQQLDADGYGATIHAWAEALAPHYPKRDRRRLRQLVELAFAYEATASVRTKDFVDFVDSQALEDPSGARARVMTIHQSKGLEFDAVVLPELDIDLLRHFGGPVMTQRSNPVAPPDRVCRSTSAAVRKLDSRLEEMYQQATTERLKEALSILYVAVTRAKHGLYMVIKPQSQAKASLSYANILKTALQGQEGNGDLLYQAGNPAWYESLRHKDSAEPEADSSELEVKTSITLLKSDVRRQRGLLKQTPSGLEGGNLVDLSFKMKLEGMEAAGRGSLVHKLFEEIDWLDDGVPAAAELLQQIDPIFVKRHRLDADLLVQEFLDMLQHDEISKALSRSAYSDGFADTLQVFKEQAFAFREADAVVTGTFDRIVIANKDSKPQTAEVLDFKTDWLAESDPQALKARVDYYRPQMEGYRRALAKYTALPVESVSAKLLFVSIGKVVEI